MREISLDACSVSNTDTSKVPTFTFLPYGDTRSGKTEFAATFPRPLIFADAAEGGYKTIANMNREKWFEGPNGPKPIIKAIDQMSDFAKFSPELDALIAAKRVMTIVFDAWSYYCDYYLAKLISLQEKKDDRKAYGDLGKHLREVRVNYGAKGVNIVWCCLAKHPNEDDPKGRPMIPGQQADKFSAGVDFLLHTRVRRELSGPGGKVVTYAHEIRTKQYDKYLVGTRLGEFADRLPDPFEGTYADFITALGYDADAVRAALPKIQPVQAVKAATPAAPAAKPPIVINKVQAPKGVMVTPAVKK